MSEQNQELLAAMVRDFSQVGGWNPKSEVRRRIEEYANLYRWSSSEGGCMDCGRPYPHGLDFVLTWKQWTMINPDGGGILCPSCMVDRASKLPEAFSMYGCIMLASDMDSTGTLESIISALRAENADYRRNNGDLLHEISLSDRPIRPCHCNGDMCIGEELIIAPFVCVRQEGEKSIKAQLNSMAQPSVPVAGEMPKRKFTLPSFEVLTKQKEYEERLGRTLEQAASTWAWNEWNNRAHEFGTNGSTDMEMAHATALSLGEDLYTTLRQLLQSQRELQVAREEIERLEWEVSHHTDGDLNDLPKTAEEITDADIAYRLEYGKTCRCIHCYWSGHIIRLRDRAERLESENAALRRQIAESAK